MKVAALGACLCLSTILFSQADSKAPSSKSETNAIWGYVFKGFDPQKEYKKELSPIVGADKRGLLLETSKGVKRSRYGQTGISLKPSVKLTPYFAEIRNFKVELLNQAQLRRENALANALESEASETQDLLDVIDSSPSGTQVPGQPDNVPIEEYRDSVQEGMTETENLRDPFGSPSGQIADSILITFQVVPNVELSDVYAAVVFYHDALDKNGEPTGRSLILSLEKVGELSEKVPNKVSFRLKTREQLIQNTEFRCFLFSGDGQAIATNASGETQAITLAQKAAISAAVSMRNKESRHEIRLD